MKLNQFILFDWPMVDTWEEWATVLAERAAAVPGADAYTDAELEELYSAALALGHMDRGSIRRVLDALRLKAPPKLHRGPVPRLAAWLLRRWRDPRQRKLMVLAAMLCFQPEYARLQAGFDEETVWRLLSKMGSPVYAACMLRQTGHADRVSRWLDGLPRDLALEYQGCLDGARVALHRLLTPEGDRADHGRQRARLVKEYRSLERHARRREAELSALQQDVTAAARARRAARTEATRTEAEVQALLAAAREDVATLQRLAEERRRARAAELAALAAHYEGLLADLDRRRAEARADFAAALADFGRPVTPLGLHGRTVAVIGDPARNDDYRLWIEATGGRMVDGAADITVLVGAAAARSAGEVAAAHDAGGIARAGRVVHCPAAGVAALARALGHGPGL